MDYEKNRRIRKDLIDFLEELSKLGKNTNFDKWSKADCAEWIAWVESKHAAGKLKECMYAKDNYTDEDRKVLCDGCEEECKYAQKEEPATSVWHDANILPSNPKAAIVEHNEYSTSICRAEQMSRIKGAKWAYVEDLLKL